MLEVNQAVRDFAANYPMISVMAGATLDQQLLMMVKQRVNPQMADMYCRSTGLPPKLGEIYTAFCAWYKDQNTPKEEKEEPQTAAVVDKQVLLNNYLKRLAKDSGIEDLGDNDSPITIRTSMIVDMLKTSKSFNPSSLKVVYSEFFPEKEAPDDADSICKELIQLAAELKSLASKLRSAE